MRKGWSEGLRIVICATRAGDVRVTVTGEMSIPPARALPVKYSPKPMAINAVIDRRNAYCIAPAAVVYGPKLNVKVTVSL